MVRDIREYIYTFAKHRFVVIEAFRFSLRWKDTLSTSFFCLYLGCFPVYMLFDLRYRVACQVPARFTPDGSGRLSKGNLMLPSFITVQQITNIMWLFILLIERTDENSARQEENLPIYR